MNQIRSDEAIYIALAILKKSGIPSSQTCKPLKLCREVYPERGSSQNQLATLLELSNQHHSTEIAH